MQNPSHQASAEDKEFLRAFDAFEIPSGTFTHRLHVRMAYIYLCENDVETACDKVRQALHRFLVHAGIAPSSKYHETITRAWLLAVRHFMNSTPATQSADEFMDANPTLLDSGTFKTHYSDELLSSEVARKSFVEPDLAPIPR